MGRIAMRRAIAALPAVVLVMSACTSAPSSTAVASAPPSAAGGAGTIAVTLQEWAVVPASTSTAAGDVSFQITNTGPEDVHEFVVLKTDLDPGALPTDANGAVTESGEGIEVIGEVEDVPVGETKELSVTLAAGKYVLLCNIYDETEKEAHYKLGMRTPFDVTG